jgi:hypothetical protein
MAALAERITVDVGDVRACEASVTCSPKLIQGLCDSGRD